MISAVGGILFFAPIFAFAQITGVTPIGQLLPQDGSISYQLLAPIGGLTGAPTLSQYLQGMFRFLIGLSGALAVIMIVICGIKYMGSGDNSGARSDARECIKNALFGVLIAIGAWMLLNTINPQTLNNNFIVPQHQLQDGTPPDEKPGTGARPAIVTPPPKAGQGGKTIYWYRYRDENGNIKNASYSSPEECAAGKSLFLLGGLPPLNANNQPCQDGDTGCISCTVTTALNQPIAQNEKDARMRLCGNESCSCGDKPCANKPVSINHGSCLAGSSGKGCTNVGGLPVQTLDFITSIASACQCQILITGGTEPGHATHAVGQPVFDLRLTIFDPLYNMIKGADAQISEREGKRGYCAFGGNRAWEYNGYYFVDEKSAICKGGVRHWHICQVGSTKCGKNIVNPDTKDAASCSNLACSAMRF